MEIELELKLAGRELELKAKGWRGLVTLIGVGLLAASVARELTLPPPERTWQGQLFGRVPYDLRPPTPRRLLATIWDPSNPRLLVPTAFGVGWGVNLGAVRALAASSA
ncbi:MAG: DUF5808 domain-containing protein [Chloroflexota bacterium]|nr:DUF5808 domain-containing protein [Chloroflexota bacterium]